MPTLSKPEANTVGTAAGKPLPRGNVSKRTVKRLIEAVERL